MNKRILGGGLIALLTLTAGLRLAYSEAPAAAAGGPGAAPSATAAGATPSSASPQSGEYLAHAADCVACHTAPGGAAFAGGRGMGSPLGTIYATNITPDPDTGIGQYTLADFDHALRQGIARDGHRLYPSMPYPSYAKITDADVAALYDYFMHSVRPVRQQNRAPEIIWSLNLRWAMGIWSWLFTEPGAYQARADRDAQWNRGAYLVQGLGHCGACHTPRGVLYQEKALTEAKAGYLAGASLDNWSATDLTGTQAQGLGRWSEAELQQFLKTGHNGSGAAFGSMIDAINYSTQYLTDADIGAMAHYLKSLPAAHDTAAWSADPATAKALNGLHYEATGSRAYVTYCAGCHGHDGLGRPPFIPALAGNPAILDPDPVSLINITLNGSSPIVVGERPDVYRMVPFRAALDDRQVAEVVSFMRGAWGNKAAPVTAQQVAELRGKTAAARYYEVDLLRMR